MWLVTYIDETAGVQYNKERVTDQELDSMFRYDAMGVLTLKNWEEVDMTMEDMKNRYPVGTIVYHEDGDFLKVITHTNLNAVLVTEVEALIGKKIYSLPSTTICRLQVMPKIQVLFSNIPNFKESIFRKAAFTGHRPNKLGGYENPQNHIPDWITYKLDQICSHMILNNQTTEFMTGMAQGVDQIAAEAILKIIEEQVSVSNGEHYVDLHAAIPFLGQEEVWANKGQVRYRSILNRIRIFEPDTNRELVHTLKVARPANLGVAAAWLDQRNHYMIDWCEVLIAVWDGSKGGTNNAIEYAKSKGKPIILLRLG